MPDITYTVEILITVNETSHAYLQSVVGIQEEIESALESVGATVHSVNVIPLNPPEEKR